MHWKYFEARLLLVDCWSLCGSCWLLWHVSSFTCQETGGWCGTSSSWFSHSVRPSQLSACLSHPFCIPWLTGGNIWTVLKPPFPTYRVALRFCRVKQKTEAKVRVSLPACQQVLADVKLASTSLSSWWGGWLRQTAARINLFLNGCDGQQQQLWWWQRRREIGVVGQLLVGAERKNEWWDWRGRFFLRENLRGGGGPSY